jgi:carboxyl-terminal processing protease
MRIMMTLTLDQRRKILENICDLVLNKHINVTNPNQDYKQWMKELERKTPLILSGSEEDFEKHLQTLLCQLRSSHTSFFHTRGSDIPAQYAINATLKHVKTPEEVDRWMFCDVVEDGPAHQAGIRPGHILLQQAKTDVLPPANPGFRIGESSVLTIINGQEKSVRDVVVNVPNRAAKDRPPMVEPKSLIYKILKPGLGYIRVHTFPGANGSAFARALDDAVGCLIEADTDRLIIDLRGNMGGGIGSLRLMSYLCPGNLPVGYSLTRRKYTSGFDKRRLIAINALPSSKVSTVWMFIKFRLIYRDRSVAMITEGLGNQPFHRRIVILVNEHTKSAAEMVTSFAGENGLATIVGTRTAGEVLGGATFSVGHGYKLRIPVAGWYTWSDVCIEGIGINPTVVVQQSPERLAAGEDPQLSAATQIASSL